nr:MAG TPA: hypothetical protein [Caudoviricetes sp.]
MFLFSNHLSSLTPIFLIVFFFPTGAVPVLLFFHHPFWTPIFLTPL